MKTTQVSTSVESHTEEPLWQELTEQEQEKIAGGKLRVVAMNDNGTWRYATWRDHIPGKAKLWFAWNGVVLNYGQKVQ